MNRTSPSTAHDPATLSVGEAPLDIETVRSVAVHDRAVGLAPAAERRMAAARAVVERHLAEGLPVYGLTRGLGSQVTKSVPAEALAEFSRLTVRGRAHSVGPSFPRPAARATLLIRAASMAAGGAGVRPELARFLLEMLNRKVHPVIPSIGSIGASDLCQLAHMGLVVIGEGEAEVEGEVMPGAEALKRAGLAAMELAPKEGLALCSANSATAARGALALAWARDLTLLADLAATLTMEGFRANLSPLDPRVAAARPQPGQGESAARLLRLLTGSALTQAGTARRLQDPLSFRCVSQVHGSFAVALAQAERALLPELNGAADNPVVLPEAGIILSNGNFHTPALALAFDAAAIGLAQSANLAVSRVGRMMTRRLTDLPDFLTREPPPSVGLAPITKTTEALAAAIRHAANPVAADQRQSAEGIEDDTTNAPLAVAKFEAALEHYALLIACELIVGAEAVDHANPPSPGVGPKLAHDAVRSLVPPLAGDRPYGAAIESLCDGLVRSGSLARQVASILGD
jgi:histidine ammonia-lyase